MKEIRIRKLHRYVAIIVAPFLVIQTLSGLFLDFGLFRRPGAVDSRGVPILLGPLDRLLLKAHFGPGMVSDTYHFLLGVGILWIAVSGAVLFFRTRNREKSLVRGRESE